VRAEKCRKAEIFAGQIEIRSLIRQENICWILVINSTDIGLYSRLLTGVCLAGELF